QCRHDPGSARCRSGDGEKLSLSIEHDPRFEVVLPPRTTKPPVAHEPSGSRKFGRRGKLEGSKFSRVRSRLAPWLFRSHGCLRRLAAPPDPDKASSEPVFKKAQNNLK